MHELLRSLAAREDDLGRALIRWFGGPPNDVNVNFNRAPTIISVATDNLDGFENDVAMKSYTESNHVLADLLGPLHEELLRQPFLFYLSNGNGQGVRIEAVRDEVFVFHLGRPYGFGDLVAAINHALAELGLACEAPWVAAKLIEHGLDPADPAFSQLST